MQYVVCLDMEGTLTPEMWIAFADAVNIPELRVTTREEPDYAKLMKRRIAIMEENGLTLSQIQDAIATVDPLPGAKEFLDELRSLTQVVILSDTFTQFAKPLMEKMGWPTIFCHELVVDENDMVTDYKLRLENQKYVSVKALRSAGYGIIAAGDSHNDLNMIREADAGFLLHAPQTIKDANPDVQAFDDYPELLAAIKDILNA